MGMRFRMNKFVEFYWCHCLVLYSELAPSFDYLFFFEKTTISSTMSSSASTSASSDGGRKLRFEKENKTILFKTIRRKIKRINQESGPLVQKNYIWYKLPYGFNSKYVKSLSDIELQVFIASTPLNALIEEIEQLQRIRSCITVMQKMRDELVSYRQIASLEISKPALK